MASAFKRKDSPFYWIRLKRIDGTWTQRSSGVRIGADGADRRISQLVAEATKEEKTMVKTGSSALFSKWVPQWLQFQYEGKNLARYVNAWAHLSLYFRRKGIVHPGEITYALCRAYMTWRSDEVVAKKDGRKPAAWNTALLELKILSIIMQQAVRMNFITVNPVIKLGLKRRKPAEKCVITIAEEELIYAKLREKKKATWMLDSFTVAMKQGCRLREVEVPLERISEEQMVIVFRVKKGGLHPAPLHKDLLPMLARAKAAGQKTLVVLPRQASARWKEFFEEIGLSHLCFHCTRVTVVTRLCEAGYSESQTMAYVGHASETVHAIYRKIRPKAVASLGDAL